MTTTRLDSIVIAGSFAWKVAQPFRAAIGTASQG
jgi:hypothetical protein